MSPANRAERTILVTDAGLGSAICIMRSLGRQGWRVIAADSDPDSLGFRSRYAHDTLLYPRPEETPAGTVAALLHAARERHVGLIIPVTDALILPLSRARAQFEGVCQLALPEAQALAVAVDKQATLALADRLGVPVPPTCLVRTVQEARDAGPKLGWPVVLKPQASRLYRAGAGTEAFQVAYAADLVELAEQMARFEGRCPVLLQAYTPGTGYGVELLLHKGQPRLAFQHKRLREIPLTGGASAFRESVALDPVLYDYATRLMGALAWTGLAMVEFKVGAGGPRLMEINGRVWGSLPLAVASGVDFPAGLAELYASTSVKTDRLADAPYRLGVRARNLGLEALWIAEVLRGRRLYPFLPMPGRHEALAAVLQLFHPAYKFDLLSWDDPAPGLAELPKIVRKLQRKVRAAARPAQTRAHKEGL